MKLIFLSKHQAGDAMSFVFSPKENITWTAGQSIRLELPGKYQIGKDDRRFTISSAPFEHKIVITTKIPQTPSWFKQKLNALSNGDEIDAFAIEGNFTLHNLGTKKSVVFIASGVGITPFRSMVSQWVHQYGSLDAQLFYEYQNSKAPFLDELNGWDKDIEGFRLHMLNNERVTADLIMHSSSPGKKTVFYISGSANMVDRISRELRHTYGIPQENVMHDWFTGLSE